MIVFERLESPLNECFGIEARRITRLNHTLGDSRHQPSGILVGQEEVDAPAAGRITVDVIEEAMIAGPNQRHAEGADMELDEQPVRKGAWSLWGNVYPGEPDSEVVGQKPLGEGVEVVGHAGI